MLEERSVCTYSARDVKDIKKIKQQDARIEMCKKQLMKKAERMATARAKAQAPVACEAREDARA